MYYYKQTKNNDLIIIILVNVRFKSGRHANYSGTPHNGPSEERTVPLYITDKHCGTD